MGILWHYVYLWASEQEIDMFIEPEVLNTCGLSWISTLRVLFKESIRLLHNNPAPQRQVKTHPFGLAAYVGSI